MKARPFLFTVGKRCTKQKIRHEISRLPRFYRFTIGLYYFIEETV